ncbi:hypothetical protein KO507_18550 [Gilvimarinus agarilyticus]|uniref:ATP-binding protein n=1 Tax=Gilvimarinus sp. 2_MG-2023 TaxID=3062666 RepID=UPI001C082EAF|nr:hypothetical protein [Gilvimarinus sp. 2_MG-2023]MBU2887770.1 hypothetical protein [Gilvimarinus agarilyticus]MDO6572409.1 hypothetical protein [Gilvimarinus sp. 2_MG-2023]
MKRTVFTPQYMFFLAAVMAMAAVVLCVWLIITAPWFGVSIASAPDRVGEVIAVDDRARSAGLAVGDKVTAFATVGQSPVLLEPLSLVSDPDRTGNFSGLNALFDHVAALYRATDQTQTEIHLQDGRKLILEASRRPLNSLSPWWWLMAAGTIPFLVGAGVWSYRRRELASHMLLLAGASFAIIALSNLIYAYRQPSIHPQLFEWAVAGNRLGTLLFFFSYLAVFLVYPRRLVSGRVLWALLVATLLLFVNELTQAVDWPGSTFAFPVVCALPATFTVIAVQWFLSRRHPVDRAALRWFVLVMMTGIILVTSLYFFPAMMGAAPVLPLEIAFGVGIVSYLGLIMAVVRYRLFQLGQWWLSAWLWLLGGGAVIGLDLLLAYWLELAPTYVLALSIFVVGWVYFPLRQWLWRKLFWQGKDPMQWLPRELLKSLISDGDDEVLNSSWHQLLSRLFQPLKTQVSTTRLTMPLLVEEGLVLQIPNLTGGGSITLAYRSGGRHLFSPDDCTLVASLLHMVGPAADARTATRRERERIMRDLHDDVGARLLTLSHRLENARNIELMTEAMQALRETIYRLNRPEGCELGEAMAEWRCEFYERLEAPGVTLHWQVAPELEPLVLSAAARVDLGRVLRESVSNSLRHSSPSCIAVLCQPNNTQRWQMVITHDGATGDPETWRPGTGILTIRRRMKDLNGSIHWQKNGDELMTTLTLPQELMA